MKSGSLIFEFETSRPAEEVAYSLDEALLPLLRSYVAEARVLEELVLGFGTSPIGLNVSARAAGPVTFTTRELSVVQRAALLHHLRPFVLNDEPYSFFRIRNIVAQALKGDFMRDRLRELKRMFGGQRLQGQMQIKQDNVLVNSEATLQRWLNAFEYHRDADKAEAFEQSMGALPTGVTRLIFTMLLIQKSDAVRYLGGIVNKLVEAYDAPTTPAA